MTILRERQIWRKRSTRSERPTHLRLTEAEQTNVHRALAFLRYRYGSWPKLATALGMSRQLVERFGKRSRPISIGSAVRAARLAKVPLEEMLTGTWPPSDACPMCGRLKIN